MRLQRVQYLVCSLLGAVAACRAAPPLARSEGMVDIGAGRRLAYVALGTGPDTVLVMHGGPGVDHRYLEEPLRPLLQGRTLIYYDQRGRGRSDAIRDSLALAPDSDVADLETVRQHFGLDRLTLIGHHWGAAVSALYAMRYPEHVARILMVSPFVVHPSLGFEIGMRNTDTTGRGRAARMFTRLRQGQDIVEACEVVWPAFFYNTLQDRTVDERTIGTSICSAPTDRIAQVENINYQVLSKLGFWSWRVALHDVQVPVLVIEGDGDEIVTMAATRWAQHLPDARVLLLSGAYGFPWLEDAKAFDQAANSFLNGGWPDLASKPAPFVALEPPKVTIGP